MRRQPAEPIMRPYRNTMWTDADYLAKLKKRSTITEAGCWELRSYRHKSRAWDGGTGYGTMCYRGRNWRANRLGYHLGKGPIPEGHVVRHTCDNQSCCNPDHLVTGTQKDNIADCIARGNQQFHPSHYTHCKHGHAFAENQRITKDGWRACKVCQRAKTRQRAGWPPHLLWLPPNRIGQQPNEVREYFASQSDRGVAK